MTQLKSAATVDFDLIDKILSECGTKKSNLIAVLQKIQEAYKYLPEDAMTYVAGKIGLSPASVYGVATFYSLFSLDPKGKYEVKICDGTACHVRGSLPVLDAVRGKLNLTDKKITTDDGKFTVETVSCLGACGLAPVVVINEKVYPQMTAEAIKIVIDTLIKEDSEG
ncbi:MAG: NAD(P)H-dependent oxidoreductase subunit E [Candidatus Gastranaerophilales bacterium]|nr:NAD(P)H-dependent oxidoreductase subunit E [Candidatus Gastranaerophilales bacterium]